MGFPLRAIRNQCYKEPSREKGLLRDLGCRAALFAILALRTDARAEMLAHVPV